MADFRADVEVSVIDTQLTALEQRLQSLENKRVPVQVQLNTNDIQNQLNQILNGFRINANNITRQMQQVGQQSGQAFSRSFNSSIGNIVSNNSANTIRNLERNLASFKFDRGQINTILQNIDQMDIAVQKVSTRIRENGQLRLNVTGIDEVGRSVTIFKEFDAATGQIRNVGKNINQTFEDVGKVAQKAATYGKELENLKAKFQSVLNIGNGTSNPFKAMVDEIDFSNITNTAQLDAMVERLKAAEAEGQRLNSLMNKKWASNAIEQINKNLVELPSSINVIEEKFKSLGTLGDSFNGSTIRDTIAQLRTEMQAINSIDSPDQKIQAYNQIASTLEQLKSKILEMQAAQRNIFTDSDVGKMRSDLANLETQFTALGTSGESFVAEVRSLRTELDGLGKSDGSEQQVNNFNRIQDSIKTLTARQAELRAEAQKTAQSMALMSGKNILGNQIETWMNKNTKAAKIYSTELQKLQSDLSKVSTQADLKNVSMQFRDLKSLAAAEGNLGKSIFGTIMGNLTKISPLFGMSAMITTSIRGLKEMYSTVVDLDTSLIDLQKTSTATYSQLNNFYFKANDIAKEYGATTKEIIQSAADWSRLGYNLEDSELMSQYSSMFKSISPGMDIDKATTGLVSMMKAYGVEAEDVLDGVMSKVNIVGNTAATSNDQIVTGLEKSSAAMAAMGSSLEENIALFTAGQEIIQNDSQVGNALRSIAMRIRGYDEETEQLSEDLVSLKGDVVDLTKVASNDFQGISLFTDETQSEYKSPFEYLRDISKIYDEIAAKPRQELLEKLFGKNRASVGAAILQNFSAAEKAMDNMANSAGNAEKEMDVITKSIEYKLNALKETITGIAQNLFKREDIGFVVDGLTSVLNIIDKITEEAGLFGTIAIGGGLTAGIRSIV